MHVNGFDCGKNSIFRYRVGPLQCEKLTLIIENIMDCQLGISRLVQ